MRTVKFLKKVLWDFEESNRNTGRTKWIKEQITRNGGTIVAHPSQVRELVKEGYFAISLETYLSKEYHIGKPNTEFFFDGITEVQIIQMKLNEAEELLKGNVR